MNSKLSQWILLIFLFFSTVRCSSAPEKYLRGEKLLNLNIKKVIRKLNKKYQISLTAIGGGTDDEGIWLVNLMFSRYGKSYTIAQARSVIVDCTQKLLSQINEDEAIRPYLKVYPLTSQNIYFAIITYNSDGTRMVDPDIEIVSCSNGGFEYSTLDPEDTYKYKTTIYETYEEALQLVQKNSSEI